MCEIARAISWEMGLSLPTEAHLQYDPTGSRKLRARCAENALCGNKKALARLQVESLQIRPYLEVLVIDLQERYDGRRELRAALQRVYSPFSRIGLKSAQKLQLPSKGTVTGAPDNVSRASWYAGEGFACFCAPEL